MGFSTFPYGKNDCCTFQCYISCIITFQVKAYKILLEVKLLIASNEKWNVHNVAAL